MTCIANGRGTLGPPKSPADLLREMDRDARRAKVTCKACGARYPALYAKHFDGHMRACPNRPLSVALDNLRRYAEGSPAEYIVDHELDYVRKLVLK